MVFAFCFIDYFFLASGFITKLLSFSHKYDISFLPNGECLNINGYRFVFTRFSPNGKYFASGSADGTVKLWDTVSNRCFNTFNAHEGAEVCSVAFTRNSKVNLV